MRATLLCLSIAVLGCPRQPAPNPATPTPGPASAPVILPAKPTKELVIQMESEPNHLNFLLLQQAMTTRSTFDSVFEPLFREKDDGSFEPVLAERFSFSSDQKTLTVTLRDGVSWHDGAPFTASDVAFTFEKIFDDKANTVGIRGSFEPLLDPERRFVMQSVKTITFHLKGPSAFFLSLLADLPILPRHIYETGDFNTHPANRAPIGTGPFLFQEWKAGERIVLRWNDKYWGKPAKLAKVTFEKVSDPAVAFELLKRGELDLIGRLRPAQLEQFKAEPNLQEDYSLGSYYPAQHSFWIFNLKNPILREKEVRKAIALLLDRETIRQEIEKGRPRNIEGPYYPESESYHKDLKPIPFDPAQAIKLLEAAGWKDKDGDGIREKRGQPLQFTFYISAGSSQLEKQLIFVQKELLKAGIQLDLVKLELSVFFDKIDRRDFDATAFIRLIPSREVDLSESFHTSQSIQGGGNVGGYQNPEADKLLAAIQSETDKTKRVALEWKLQEILREDLPLIFMFGDRTDYLASKEFTIPAPSPYSWFSLRSIE